MRSRPSRALPIATPEASSRVPARLVALAIAAAALALAGCSSTPRSVGGRDGPGRNPPSDLERVPDAVPRVEALRSGGANKPYEVNGRDYVPLTGDVPLQERGLASWYGAKFHGRPTAIGEPYDMYAMTAAHPTMPLPSYARVRNPANGREVIVRVNDRGPFHPGRVIDLSYTAALKLGLLRGVAPVEVERLTNARIADGSWRRGRDAEPAAVVAQVQPAPRRAPAEPVAVPAPEAQPAGAGAETGMAPVPLATAATGPDADSAPPSAAPAPPVAPGYWVQLGVFRQPQGARSFQQQVAQELGWLAPALLVVAEQPLHRLQAGPYASREEAGGVADRVRDALKLVPVVIERR